MAIMNEKALKIIKMKFEEKEFIEDNGVIYKQVLSDKLQLNNKSVRIRRIINIIKSFNEKGQESELEKEYKVDWNKFLDNSNYIVEDDKLYKKYGTTNKRGYVQFVITLEGISYFTYNHRVIYYIHYGIWDDKRVINHLDGNKSNNHIENLELITQFENILYSIRNNEIVFEPQFIDERTKLKYKLNDVGWEIFKQEAYEGYKRHTLRINKEGNIFFEACKISNTLDEYYNNINILSKRNKNE